MEASTFSRFPGFLRRFFLRFGRFQMDAEGPDGQVRRRLPAAEGHIQPQPQPPDHDSQRQQYRQRDPQPPQTLSPPGV